MKWGKRVESGSSKRSTLASPSSAGTMWDENTSGKLWKRLLYAYRPIVIMGTSEHKSIVQTGNQPLYYSQLITYEVTDGTQEKLEQA
jgi:hypothetical protein